MMLYQAIQRRFKMKICHLESTKILLGNKFLEGLIILSKQIQALSLNKYYGLETFPKTSVVTVLYLFLISALLNQPWCPVLVFFMRGNDYRVRSRDRCMEYGVDTTDSPHFIFLQICTIHMVTARALVTTSTT